MLRLGQAQEARREIGGALSLAPGEPTAEMALAEIDLAEGRFSEAEKRIRRVLGKTPQPEQSQILLGRILLEGGKPAQAIPIFEALVESQPPRSDLLYLEAQALLRGGRREEGRKALERFQKLKEVEGKIRLLEVEVSTNPEDLEAGVRLVTLLLDHRMERSASVPLAQLRRQAPEDPRVKELLRRFEAATR